MAEIVLKIEGMSCQHCVVSISKALKDLKGIKDVKVSLEKGSAEVSYDDTLVTLSRMKDAVTNAGYTVIN